MLNLSNFHEYQSYRQVVVNRLQLGPPPQVCVNKAAHHLLFYVTPPLLDRTSALLSSPWKQAILHSTSAFSSNESPPQDYNHTFSFRSNFGTETAHLQSAGHQFQHGVK
jgi:hypothetical protein